MKVYVTKYWATKGIFECEGNRASISPEYFTEAKKATGLGLFLKIGVDCFETYEAAHAAVVKKCEKKVKSLRKSANALEEKWLNPSSEKRTVWLQTWTERERGWGQRPDGVSLHLTKEDGKEYNKQYWAEEKKRNPSGVAPDEYSSPDENWKLVYVDDATYKELTKVKNLGGKRVYGKTFEVVP